jgi:hypothetical protein
MGTSSDLGFTCLMDTLTYSRSYAFVRLSEGSMVRRRTPLMIC